MTSRTTYTVYYKNRYFGGWKIKGVMSLTNVLKYLFISYYEYRIAYPNDIYEFEEEPKFFITKQGGVATYQIIRNRF